MELQSWVRKLKPIFVGLQETKRIHLYQHFGRKFLGESPHNRDKVLANGNSEGILFLWDTCKEEVLKVLRGEFSLSALYGLITLMFLRGFLVNMG